MFGFVFSVLKGLDSSSSCSLICSCYIFILKSLVLCNLISWSSHNSTYGTFDPFVKLSILMKTCFSEDIMPAVEEGSVTNNTVMCLDLF